MKIRQMMLRGAVVVALAGAGVGIGAGTASASTSTSCARWVSQAIAAQELGDQYGQKSQDFRSIGLDAWADYYADLAIQSYLQSSDYFDMVHRNNCQIP